MLIPAIIYKEEIEKQFALLQYTDKMLWYTGSIDNYDMEVKTEGDKCAFAIVHGGQVVGYISFRVDWYCSMAYNFSLIKFMDIYFNCTKQEYRGSTPLMASAIREVIRKVEDFNLHRIDFRCVSGNPAEIKYWRILKLVEKSGKWYWHGIKFTDNIKDRQGKYHDTICYELIRKEAENER